MISVRNAGKLNEKDIAAITRFVDNIQRIKNSYTQKQQALIDIAARELKNILDCYNYLHSPSNQNAPISPAFNDRRLDTLRKTLIAIQDEIQVLKEKATAILAISNKLK